MKWIIFSYISLYACVASAIGERDFLPKIPLMIDPSNLMTIYSNPFIDSGVFIGDFHGAGVEYVIPFIRDVDVNGDGSVDSIAIRYLIYKKGSSAPLYIGTQSVFPYPVLPCSVPLIHAYHKRFYRDVGASVDSSILLRGGENRLHAMLVLFSSCPSSNDIGESTAIHSARLDATTPGVDLKWKRFFPGWGGYQINGVDLDGDNIDDHLTIIISRERLNGIWEFRIPIMNVRDGKADPMYPERAYDQYRSTAGFVW